MPSLAETLTWLVDIPSVTGDESVLRDAIADRLASMTQKKIARSLVAGNPGAGRVLLVGHLDTVPLQGHVGARVEGDRLYGLGATDMKGGLAVMIHLIEDLGPDQVGCVFYSGEEGPIAGNDLGLVLEEAPWLKAATAAFVMEPTNREIHYGCQGAVNARVTFEGTAAHSARPWLGENAVTKSAGFLAAMAEIEPELHVVGGIEFNEVVSITRASGGVANNIIPAEFAMNVNYRFAPDRSIEEAVERLRQICSAADRFEVSDLAPAGAVESDHPLFTELLNLTGAEIGGKQGWTDVAQMSAAGVPAVNFGPGETSLAHRPGESVRLDDLDWAYESLAALLG